MIEVLVDLLDVKPEQRDEAKKSIKQSIYEGKFQNIKDIGFFTWREVWKYGTLHIYIENMFILPTERKTRNLLSIRSFFRDKYPIGVKFFYWRNKKKWKFFYCK